MARVIRFLFDYISPYAYLASTQVRTLGARHGCGAEAVPVLLAGLLGAAGTKGPAEIPVKRDYLFQDILRRARMLGVPVEVPATHPFKPLAALRATGCVAGAQRWRLVDALFDAAWVKAQRIDQADVVARVADALGMDGAALVQTAGLPESKDRLRETTDAAIAAGAFGVPTMLVDEQLFWGVDSLPLLERFLEGEDAVDAERIKAWRAVAPSATRSGA